MDIIKKEETGSVVNWKQSGCQQTKFATEDRRIAITNKKYILENRLFTVSEITNSMSSS